MEKEIRMIEEEIKELNKFENIDGSEQIISFSESCGAHLTLICC